MSPPPDCEAGDPRGRGSNLPTHNSLWAKHRDHRLINRGFIHGVELKFQSLKLFQEHGSRKERRYNEEVFEVVFKLHSSCQFVPFEYRTC